MMPPGDAKVSSVRTTIRIDDALYRDVKQRAAMSGRTIAAVLEDAVRRGLNPTDQGSRARFTVQTTGTGGLRPGVDLSSNAVLAEAMYDETALDAMRCVDTNVLVYAHRADLPENGDYRALLEEWAMTMNPSAFPISP